jgi:hypothetical protein
VRSVLLLNSSINASSSYGGSGIGTADSPTGNSTIAELTISHSRVRARGSPGGAAIGSGGAGGVQSLWFSRSCVIECLNSEGIVPLNASSISLSGSLVFVADDVPLFGRRPSRQGTLDFAVFYRNAAADVATEFLPPLDAPPLRIKDLRVPAERDLTFCVNGSDTERCFRVPDQGARSLIASVPAEGRYSIKASARGLSGRLASLDGSSDFDVRAAGPIVAVAQFVPSGDAAEDASAPDKATASAAGQQGLMGTGSLIGVTFAVAFATGMLTVAIPRVVSCLMNRCKCPDDDDDPLGL